MARPVRAALVPLVLIWLALHAAALGLLLAIKFLGAKALVLGLALLAVVWFLTRPKTLRLTPPRTA